MGGSWGALNDGRMNEKNFSHLNTVNLAIYSFKCYHLPFLSETKQSDTGNPSCEDEEEKLSQLPFGSVWI